MRARAWSGLAVSGLASSIAAVTLAQSASPPSAAAPAGAGASATTSQAGASGGPASAGSAASATVTSGAGGQGGVPAAVAGAAGTAGAAGRGGTGGTGGVLGGEIGGGCGDACTTELADYSDDRRRVAVEIGAERLEALGTDADWGARVDVSFEIPLGGTVFLGPRIGIGSRIEGDSFDVVDVTLAALPMTRLLGTKWPVGIRIAPGVGYASSYGGEPDQLAAVLSLGLLVEHQPYADEYYESLAHAEELAKLARRAALCESWQTLSWARKHVSEGLAKELAARVAECADVPAPALVARDLRKAQALVLARQRGAGVGIRFGAQYTLRLTEPGASGGVAFFGGIAF